jgi:hypothetical protein
MSEVWVKCEICGKGFDSYEALIAHIYSHIAELKQKLQQIQYILDKEYPLNWGLDAVDSDKLRRIRDLLEEAKP